MNSDIDKKNLILEKAKDMIITESYSSLSISKLTSELNISKGSFYTYFPSKDNMLAEILNEYSENAKVFSNNLVSNSNSIDECLDYYVNSMLNLNDRDLKLELVMTSLKRNYEVFNEENFIIRCNGNANEVMRLARDVLLKVNYQYDLYTKSKWDDVEAWKKILPIQFINGFKKVKSRFDIFGFFYRKREDDWTFDNWIFLMDPIARSWFWWGATILDEDHFLFATKVLDDPFLSGTLRWLFIGCGAIEVVEEGDF